MDTDFLIQALEQAKKAVGYCAPNPAVGAVIVKAGQKVGAGYHRGIGTDHAEVDAIKQAGDVRGATIYVTLEPCCHTGRTPPCTKAIIEAGIARVVFACRDPNRHTAETGELVLKEAGISCDVVAIPEIESFYRYYFHWLKTKTPWLTAKLAVSFDGKIAGPVGKTVKITGEDLEKFTHQKRLQADGILTTVKTIIADDPQLNVRLNNTVTKKPLFILDSDCNLPLIAKVFETVKSVTIFHKPNVDSEKIKALIDKQVTCIPIAYNQGLYPNDLEPQTSVIASVSEAIQENQRGSSGLPLPHFVHSRNDGSNDNPKIPSGLGMDLGAVKNYLGKIGLHHVWIEAGGVATSSFLKAGLLDEFLLYIAPILLGPKAVPAFSEVMNFERYVKKFEVKI